VELGEMKVKLDNYRAIENENKKLNALLANKENELKVLQKTVENEQNEKLELIQVS
jgi:hypothetical protein